MDLSVAAGLPIAAQADAITDLIRDHQVVVVAGETGSGKTTQLPKLCLALGRERIAHTQPRRIAARTVAARVAQEIGSPVGQTVGFQVRFTKAAGTATRLTEMTDGILLAQIGQDRELLRYDTIIIDEAHERSLNIDFLLGYLKQLLPRRGDLKVIITSATIDTARFAAHFGDAPVVEVSGRGHPVELWYRPPSTTEDQNEAILAAVKELRQAGHGRGDILVFLAGEREIRDATETLAAAALPGVELLPLYARLSAAEQQRAFAPHAGQRIVLATNVAETSLTVPGVRYVIDPGFARISRYSARTKVQRLPIEPISRASADQRAGRCGRVAPGICVRLYTEEDYLARPAFIQPEILRTNLASVILQMAHARLGDIARFPFLEAPDASQIADGLRLLAELGAITGRDASHTGPALTPIGRQLATLPIDPRLGRILLEAGKRGCLREALILVSGYSIQDIRERPTDQRAQADAMHARFAADPGVTTPDPGGDISAMLRLWAYLRDLQRELSGNQFRRRCRAEYLNYLRVREWQDLAAQLRHVCADLKLRQNSIAAPSEAVLTSVLSGFLSQIGLLQTDPPAADKRRRTPAPRQYLGTRGSHFVISPASVLARHPPPLAMAVELVETTRLWAHAAAGIEPSWVEAVGEHLIKRRYASPHFSSDSGTVVAYETATLLGVPLVSGRLAGYAAVDPGQARSIFIREALVERAWTPPPGSPARPVTDHNWWVWEQAEALEERRRRRDLLISQAQLYDFFDARLPSDIVSVAALEAWLRREAGAARALMAREDDLLLDGAGPLDLRQFPDTWEVAGLPLPTRYVFEPGAQRDGVTVELTLAGLGAVPVAPFTWQVPGLRREVATELIRSLPKAVRTRFVPAPDWADRALAWLRQHEADQARPLTDELARALLALTGERIDPPDWHPESIPPALRVGFLVCDGEREAGYGKDLAALKDALAPRVEARLTRAVTAPGQGAPSGTTWVFGELPDQVDAAVGIVGYPALRDDGARVTQTVYQTVEKQQAAHRAGVLRLLDLTLPDPSRYTVAYLSGEDRLALATSPYADASDLWADVRRKAIERLASADGDPAGVRTRAGFEALAASVRRGLADQVRLVAQGCASILRQYVEVSAAVERLGRTNPAASEVRSQVDDLVFPGFVAFTRDPWFGYLPRYLRAAGQRLASYPADPGRDQARQHGIDELLAEYARLVDAQPPGRLSAAVEDVGYLIEELRIQTFAQSLGTHVTVSPTRIRRAMAEVGPTRPGG